MKFSAITLVTVIALCVFSTSSYSQSAKIEVPTNDTTKSITAKVKGIGCAVDLEMISTNVEKLNGVSECEATKMGPTTTFTILFNPALVSEEEIHKAIENTGSCEDPNEHPYKVKK